MPANKKIPFCDLKRQYLFLKEEVDGEIKKVLYSGWYILGREVEAFEKEFAAYCGCSFGIGVGSGTEALHIALLACGIKPKDEVITVANAGVPMVVAITLAGAVPVFVDINPDTYNIDVSKIERKITKKTKAILPVHLYGQCADMKQMLKIAKKHRLKIIEDACQAHGASYRDRKAGSMGDMGCFSFYPTKNLGGYGDGGMIVTNNKSLAKRSMMLRDYGQIQRYRHEIKGFNSRLDEMQATILKIKLKYLDKWNDKRAKIAQIYNKNITNGLILKPGKAKESFHVYHLYVIACRCRDELQSYLRNNGIQTLIHYPVPVYRQKAYAEFGSRNDCKITDRYSEMVLSLPLYPEMEKEEVFYICDIINKFKV